MTWTAELIGRIQYLFSTQRGNVVIDISRFRLKFTLFYIPIIFTISREDDMICDYCLPAWKIKQLKKFHKNLKQKHETNLYQCSQDIQRYKVYHESRKRNTAK